MLPGRFPAFGVSESLRPFSFPSRLLAPIVPKTSATLFAFPLMKQTQENLSLDDQSPMGLTGSGMITSATYAKDVNDPVSACKLDVDFKNLKLLELCAYRAAVQQKQKKADTHRVPWWLCGLVPTLPAVRLRSTGSSFLHAVPLPRRRRVPVVLPSLLNHSWG